MICEKVVSCPCPIDWVPVVKVTLSSVPKVKATFSSGAPPGIEPFRHRHRGIEIGGVMTAIDDGAGGGGKGHRFGGDHVAAT
jgi:hypothetical protein